MHVILREHIDRRISLLSGDSRRGDSRIAHIPTAEDMGDVSQLQRKDVGADPCVCPFTFNLVGVGANKYSPLHFAFFAALREGCGTIPS